MDAAPHPPDTSAPSDDAVPHPPEQPLVVLHAANFPLPAYRDEYGTEVVRTMNRNGIFVSCIEFDRPAVGTKLFAAAGIPLLHPDDFSPAQVLWSMKHQSGLQRFFHVGARAFCIYIVIGSHAMRRLLVPEANRFLSGFTIEG